MEQREHPRIQLPLLVELQHPALGRARLTARDVSEGGVFVSLERTSGIKVGAKVKLTLLNPTAVEAAPTPTVDMEVRRVEDHGLGLSFSTKTSRHLWQSVERLRDELAVGRDYFQVHVSAAVRDGDGRLLLVQLHGKWGFPGTYLVVGESWQDAIAAYLTAEFGVTAVAVDRVLAADSGGAPDLPEAAVVQLVAGVSVDAAAFQPASGSRYRNHRWVARRKDIEELTFGRRNDRSLASGLLEPTADGDGSVPA